MRCGICKSTKINLHSIFLEENGISYAAMLMSAAAVQIKEACDSWICFPCIKKLKKVYNCKKGVEGTKKEMVVDYDPKLTNKQGIGRSDEKNIIKLNFENIHDVILDINKQGTCHCEKLYSEVNNVNTMKNDAVKQKWRVPEMESKNETRTNFVNKKRKAEPIENTSYTKYSKYAKIQNGKKLIVHDDVLIKKSKRNEKDPTETFHDLNYNVQLNDNNWQMQSQYESIENTLEADDSINGDDEINNSKRDTVILFNDSATKRRTDNKEEAIISRKQNYSEFTTSQPGVPVKSISNGLLNDAEYVHYETNNSDENLRETNVSPYRVMENVIESIEENCNVTSCKVTSPNGLINDAENVNSETVNCYTNSPEQDLLTNQVMEDVIKNNLENGNGNSDDSVFATSQPGDPKEGITLYGFVNGELHSETVNCNANSSEISWLPHRGNKNVITNNEKNYNNKLTNNNQEKNHIDVNMESKKMKVIKTMNNVVNIQNKDSNVDDVDISKCIVIRELGTDGTKEIIVPIEDVSVKSKVNYIPPETNIGSTDNHPSNANISDKSNYAALKEVLESDNVKEANEASERTSGGVSDEINDTRNNTEHQDNKEGDDDISNYLIMKDPKHQTAIPEQPQERNNNALVPMSGTSRDPNDKPDNRFGRIYVSPLLFVRFVNKDAPNTIRTVADVISNQNERERDRPPCRLKVTRRKHKKWKCQLIQSKDINSNTRN